MLANSSCCALLSSALPGLIALPGTVPYNATELAFWSTQEASLSPSCIVTAKTAQHVATAVGLLAQNDCRFAIKSQGHAPAAGFANIGGDGVTIDLAGLNSIALDEGHSVTQIGSGATWLEVYAALDVHNLTAAGGRNGQVGVGGLLLGGGISYIGPRVGWACDNVVNFETVLASGQILNANAQSAPDLFRALKGGGNNFGVVTRFDLRTFEQGDILAGHITSPLAQRDAVFDAFTALAGAKDYDIYAEVVTGVSYTGPNGSNTVGTIAAYTKAQSPQQPPAAFKGFLAPPETTSTLAVTSTHAFANESAIPIRGEAFCTGTYGVSAALMRAISDRFQDVIDATPIPGILNWGWNFEPLPTVFTQYGARNGGNALGTEPADGNAMVLLLSPTWNDSSSDALVYSTMGQMMDQADGVARQMGLLHEFQYLNYAGPGQNPPKSYGEANLEMLRAASKMYDPHGVFQRLVPGGFKLWPGA